MRFGLNGKRPHTLDEIGKDFGVTRERVRQIIKAGLGKNEEDSLQDENYDVEKISQDIEPIKQDDSNHQSSEKLGERLNANFPTVEVLIGKNDPEGFDLIVNATPLGMKEGDPMPVDINRISPDSFVGEVVLKAEMTAFLEAAYQRGCKVQVGSDMLFEQIPVYLEYFGFETTTPQELRLTAKLDY